ncbi:MAG: CdaR family protein [Anaerolineales bacterium]
MRNFAANLRTFLLALVLAVAVWVSAVTAADPDEVRAPIKVPVEIVGRDNALVLTSKVPSTIEVTLRAPKSTWEKLTAHENSVRAFLDLSGLSAGEHDVEIKVQVTERPTQIVLINPTTTTVNLEPYATQTLPVNLSLSGQSATGYRAGDAALDPAEVTISGPKSLVDLAKRARVQVNLSGTRESVDQAIPVEILDEKNAPIDGVSVSPQTIHINIPISQQGGFRDVAVESRRAGTASSRLPARNDLGLPAGGNGLCLRSAVDQKYFWCDRNTAAGYHRCERQDQHPAGVEPTREHHHRRRTDRAGGSGHLPHPDQPDLVEPADQCGRLTNRNDRTDLTADR